MAFDWKEYLDLAEFLVGGGGQQYTQEAACRSAVSRSYYAAFCHARNFARNRLGYSPTYDYKEHGFVRDHFIRQGRANIASKLDMLRQWRNDCDYDDFVQAVAALPKFAITEAREVVDKL